MIKISALKKSFNGHPALNGIELNLKSGEIFGLLGPNGAGKTTTIKILSGLLSFDSGSITVDGKEYNRNDREIKKKIAYVPDEPFVYPKLTGEEHMNFFADLYGISRKGRDEKIDFFFKYFEFNLYRNELVETYSAGTKQKLLISQAILVDPDILLLDEPIVSIDPVVGKKFKILLKQLSEKGKIIIFATHILPLAQEVSTRIGIIINGVIDMDGAPDSLRKKSGNRNLEDLYFERVMAYEDSL